MAKSNILLIKMVSTAGTGFTYTKKKNPRTKTEKFRMRKYDPIAGEHVDFEEQKLKS
ncbi:MAG: 50S ribosomal protein L33 [Dongiaceae bacterium]